MNVKWKRILLKRVFSCMKQLNWIIIATLIFYSVSKAEDIVKTVNLMPNPGAEDYQVTKKGIKKTQAGWGAYLGAGKGEWGVTDKEAHTGNNSVFLTFRDFYTYTEGEKAGKKIVSLALTLGESNGYDGKSAIKAEPDTPYEFSFWIKGNIPTVKVVIKSWKTAEALPLDRERLSITRIEKEGKEVKSPIALSSEWVHYRGTFITKPDTKRFVIELFFVGETDMFKSGQTTFYVDDVMISYYPVCFNPAQPLYK